MLKRLSLLLISLLLSGCISTAFTGADLIYNRHHYQQQYEDHYVKTQIQNELKKQPEIIKDTHVVLAAYQDEVLVTGQVARPEQRERIIEIVKFIPGVKRVFNHLTVKPKTSMTRRSKDAWLTTKVKSKLLASNDVDPSKVKVLTENGQVFLMGIIDRQQAAAAAELAAKTRGVKKVVKIFRYISYS